MFHLKSRLMRCGLTYRKLLHIRKTLKDSELSNTYRSRLHLQQLSNTYRSRLHLQHFLRLDSYVHLQWSPTSLSSKTISTLSQMQVRTFCSVDKHNGVKLDTGESDKVRLHQRILSAEDLDKDSQLSESLTNLEEKDTFGILEESNAEPLAHLRDYHLNRQNKNGSHKSAQKHGGKIKTQRVLSDSELEEERKFLENVAYTSREDTFGEITGKQTKEDINDKMKIKNTGREILAELHKNHHKKTLKSKNRKKEVFNPNMYDRKWKNTFGTLSEEPSFEEDLKGFPEEEGEDLEVKPHLRLVKRGRRHEAFWYGKKILEFGKEGKVKEAIEVLEVWMLKEDRVKPDNFVLTALLTTLGRAGYTKKAFQIYHTYRKLGLKPNLYVYSCLFNACANSPWPDDGLQRATVLLEDLAIKDIKPNAEMYNAMIKAFAFCGDSKTAYLLADKLQNETRLGPVTYSHVLMAAISDKKAGFWYAVQVWRWMLIKRVQPDLKLYNLMLRVIRDCAVGDQNLAKEMLTSINPATTLKFFKKGSPDDGRRDKQSLRLGTGNQIIKEPESGVDNQVKQSSEYDLESPHVRKYVDQQPTVEEPISSYTSDVVNDSSHTGHLFDTHHEHDVAVVPEEWSRQTDDDQVKLPNVLNINENFSDILSVDTIASPQDRFAMVGGMKGFLNDMEKNGVKPDIQTFDQMLPLVNHDDELELLAIMDSRGIKADVDFYANLMMKRCRRRDYSGAKDVLEMVERKKLVCNMRVYSTLALTCTSFKDGIELITKLRNLNLSPNIVVYGALVKTSGFNFYYKKVLLKMMTADGLKPDQRLLKTIEHQLAKARNIIAYKEKSGTSDKDLERFDSSFEDFKDFYQSWLQTMDLHVPDHPWASFRKNDTLKVNAER